jgi:hypothetical protein
MGTMNNLIAPITNIKFDIEVALGNNTIHVFTSVSLYIFHVYFIFSGLLILIVLLLSIFFCVEQQLGAVNLPFPGMDSEC